jgi:hypothetical protein
MTKRGLSLNRKYDESDPPFTPARVTVRPLRSACVELRFRFTARGHEACASASAGAFCGTACASFRRRRSTRFVSPCIPVGIWKQTTSGCLLPVDCPGLAADATAGCRDRQSHARSRPADERSMVAQPFLGTPRMRSVVRLLDWRTPCTPLPWLSATGCVNGDLSLETISSF